MADAEETTVTEKETEDKKDGKEEEKVVEAPSEELKKDTKGVDSNENEQKHPEPAKPPSKNIEQNSVIQPLLTGKNANHYIPFAH